MKCHHTEKKRPLRLKFGEPEQEKPLPSVPFWLSRIGAEGRIFVRAACRSSSL